MSSVLDRIKDKIEKRQQSRAEEYAEIVRRIADGKEPPIDQIEAVLEAEGKSVDQLRSDVGKLKDRRALLAKVVSMPALDAEYLEVQKKIADFDKKIEDFRLAVIEECRPVHARRQQILEEIREAGEAEQKLRNTCSPELLAQIRRMESRRRDLYLKTEAKRDDVSRLEAQFKSADAEAKRHPGNNSFQTEADRAKTELDRAKVNLADLEKQEVEFEEEASKLSAEQLQA